MSDKEVHRVTSHLCRDGTMRYYSAYDMQQLMKATRRNVHPEAFLCKVRWPTREYLWYVRPWAPRPKDARMDNPIMLGVSMQRYYHGPVQPGVMLPFDEAFNLWRQYTYLMWSQRNER